VAQRAGEDDDELEDDPDDDDPDDDDDDPDDDDDDDPDDDESGDDDPEDRSRDAARAPQVPAEARAPEPTRLAFVDPGAAAGAPGPSAPAAPIARGVGSWLPLEDDRVGYVLVYRAGQGGSYIARLVRPFPREPLERWAGHTYGPGRYRFLQRGNPPLREYIGSLTVNAAEIPTAPNGNGNGNDTVSVPPSAALPAPYTGPMDYRLALITTGLPLLATALGEFAKAISARPQRSELDTLVAAAKILQTPNEERTKLFRDGIALARELEPPRGSGDGEGLFNMRDILSGVGEIVKTWRESRPASPPASSPASPAAAAAAARPPAGELQAQPGETPQAFVERAIVMEIRRAVGSADTPDTLVVLISSWLPSTVVSWLESAPEDEVLEQLPKQFPAHADYLREPEVQRFLRSALAMLREDAAAERSEGDGVREPASAGA
jgi:hypothetical protein